MPRLEVLVQKLEKKFPLKLKEEWDNVGLMIGNPMQEVNKVLLTLDVNLKVVEEAIENNVQCIISHHPLFFKGLKNINLSTSQGKIIEKLITHNIAVYSMHTNYDVAEGGLNDELCQMLELKDCTILETTYKEKLYKVAVYVPITHREQVREAIISHMTTCIGNYAGCTFSYKGEGTFMPLEGSNPYVGNKDNLCRVEENKIEFIVAEGEVSSLLSCIKKVHPYEEVAIDQYELCNISKEYGIGRYGKLEVPISVEDFIKKVKQCFKVDYVRVTPIHKSQIQTVALCSGAGSEYINKAAKVADVYITGDLKFHEGQMADALNLTVIDVGHYASENIALAPIERCICNCFKDCKVIYSTVNGETLTLK